MPDQYAYIIEALGKQWNRNNLLAALIRVLAVSLLVAAAAWFIFHWSVWIILLLFIVTALLVWFAKPYRGVTPATVASFLNRTYPEMEESAQLLLEPASSLSLLQRMQVQKISGPVQNIAPPQAITQPIKRSAFLLLGAIVAGAAIAGITYALPANKTINNNKTGTEVPAVKEILLPGIASREINITPPAYTGRHSRQQQQFALQVEEGSHLQWTISTTQKVKKLELLFNNRETVPLQPVDKDSTEWTLNRTIQDAGFYQVSLDGMLSQLYTLEVVNDLPVRITIVTPQQYTTINPGFDPVTKLAVQLADDYGIANALIVATKASGKGESVSFKEQTLNFPVSFANQQEVNTAKLLDLPALGIKPGDELYFYVKATDNHGQESRSDMYFISLPDTAELFSMSGMEAGVSQVPEYFRSQRQLIIDTEKLLREQANTNADSFKLRSNELGEDQKILRLRYGKFLGEEYESGGHSPEDGHDHSNQTITPADMDALIDQYAHKHDNAEDASYFEPEQKAQLKAILTEMWGSELKLRTYATKESLPYQYKALRLLKDMQQKSRVYVGKTSVKMPPIKPEKRLTGELDKIGVADNNKNNIKEENSDKPLQQAMAVMEQVKQHQPLQPADQLLLQAAEKAISEKAIHLPASYLPALSAVRAIREEPAKATRQQISLAEAALQQIIKSREQAPQQTMRRSGTGLTDYYFKNLQNPGR